MMQRCKGTRDLMPDDMAKFRQIEEIFRTCCLRWGYQEVRTPTLEYLHLFTSTGTLTPGMLSRVYSFLDWDGWSGERVVLRPDGTIPAARLYMENLREQPLARLFYVENIFSFEGTGQESRERWQCGAEFIGSSKLEGDVELILMALEVLKKLGVAPVEVRLSHAGLIRALLKELGLETVEDVKLLEQKASEVKGNIPGVKEALHLLFSLEGRASGFAENLKSVLSQSFPTVEPSFDELSRIAELLSTVGANYRISIDTGKGFEYYTGTNFQLYGLGRVLGGGGRYDELIPLLGGSNVPASGFALYVDPIMDLIRSDDLKLASQERILVKAKSGVIGELKGCFEIAGLLREMGYIVELAPGYRETTGLRWIVSVQTEDKATIFDLTDQVSGKRFRGVSATEIVKWLEKEGATKTGIT